MQCAINECTTKQNKTKPKKHAFFSASMPKNNNFVIIIIIIILITIIIIIIITIFIWRADPITKMKQFKARNYKQHRKQQCRPTYTKLHI